MLADFDRQRTTTLAARQPAGVFGGVDDAAMEEAAEALREAEVLAQVPDLYALDETQLEQMSIDELRAVAGALNVPHRAQITEQDELIDAIRRCL
jgi:hypothetical protein